MKDRMTRRRRRIGWRGIGRRKRSVVPVVRVSLSLLTLLPSSLSSFCMLGFRMMMILIVLPLDLPCLSFPVISVYRHPLSSHTSIEQEEDNTICIRRTTKMYM